PEVASAQVEHVQRVPGRVGQVQRGMRSDRVVDDLHEGGGSRGGGAGRSGAPALPSVRWPAAREWILVLRGWLCISCRLSVRVTRVRRQFDGERGSQSMCCVSLFLAKRGHDIVAMVVVAQPRWE